MVRQEHGTDIDAACGQLRSNTMKRDRQKSSRSSQSLMMKKTYNRILVWGVIFL